MKVMVIVKASKASEAGDMGSPEMFAAMDKFNQELINAGIMLDGTGLTPSSRGARVRFSGSNRTVTDGPFAETTEIIAGFSIWKVSSLQDAIDWVKKSPNCMIDDHEIEIRPLLEPEDFAGLVTPERLEEVKELEARSADRDGYGLARFK
jgi:AraC family transcriptional regulator